MLLKLEVAILLLAQLIVLASCGTGRFDDQVNLVRETQLDPRAAEFRKVEPCFADANAVSGEVNGKNAFGAFTGFRAFVVSESRVTFVEEAIGSDPQSFKFKALIQCFGAEIVKQALPKKA